MRPIRLWGAAVVVAGLVLGAPLTGHARQPAIALLNFGGSQGPGARATLTNALSRRYEIVDGQEILDACDALGITMTRGPNLARAAARIGVGAVIGGAVAGRGLSLAVYSGKSGQVLASGRVPYRGRFTKPTLRKALTLVLGGLKRAPKRYRKRRAVAVAPAPAPAPAPEPEPAPAPSPPPRKSAANTSLTFDPDPVISGTTTGQESDTAEENPLEPSKGPVVVPAPAPTPGTTATTTVTKKPEKDEFGAPKVAATVGLGIWKRSFEPNQPDEFNKGHPKYDSGAAFALGVGFKARPVAFFSDGWLASFYSRLHYQMMLGLESKNTAGGEPDKTYSTSLWELCWEIVGYDWNILGKATSPHVEAGIGFGLMSFSIDWEDATEHAMPDASYKFFLAAVGAYMPIISMLGAHFRFDYRAVSGTGEIEEDDWYGPATAGGINLLVGVTGNYLGIVARLDYAYTRYFYTFTDTEARREGCPGAACKKHAGGALDILHGFTLNLGYSY